MNSINKEIKSAIIIEKNQEINSFLKTTISLIGFDDIRIEESFDFNITQLDNISIFTNINQLAEVSKWLEEQGLNKVQTILYQTENNQVTNFWNNGVIKNSNFQLDEISDNIYIRTRGKLEKICKKDILYVESDKKYCTIITTQKKYVIRTALKSIDSQLKDKNFIRVHRSFLINQEYIQYIDTQNLNIEIGAKKIAIGRRYQEELFKQLMILH